MTKGKEFYRQLIHALYAPVLILLYFKGILDIERLGMLVILFLFLIIIIKWSKKTSLFGQFLKQVERETDFTHFPLRGPFFFSLGALLSFYFFEVQIAYASILTLGVLDSVSTIIGKNFGNHRWFFNNKKSLEGSFSGFITAFLAALFFVNPVPALIASFLAMLIEIPELHFFGLKIDDNLTIPLLAGTVLTYCF